MNLNPSDRNKKKLGENKTNQSLITTRYHTCIETEYQLNQHLISILYCIL